MSKLASVPAVKGTSLTKAKRKLRSVGLEVGDIDRRPSSKRKDTVEESHATCDATGLSNPHPADALWRRAT
jgi:hypothetical protein